MYCPSCGKSDQEKNTYCRQCGEFLPGLKSKGRSGQPITPDAQIKMSITFNLMSAIAGIAVGILLLVNHLDREGTHFSVFIAISLLFTISAWQIVSFFNNLKLHKRFKRQREDESEEEIHSDQQEFEPIKTKDLLPEANLSDVVPASVTENTTKSLKQKIRRQEK